MPPQRKESCEDWNADLEKTPLFGKKCQENLEAMSYRRIGTDGPLAWAVAFSNFLINLAVVGLGRMSGILYVVFMHVFHTDRQTAAVPFAVQQAARNLFGPLAGILGQKYGIRIVTIVGGVIGTVGTVSCYYAMDINSITLLWGLVFGLCTALTTTLNQVTIDQYFEKHKTTAGGLAFSGGCVGAFVFPILLEYLLEIYGMGPTFLVMGAIIFCVVPSATILGEPPWMKNEKFLKKIEEKIEQIEQQVNSGYNTFQPPPPPPPPPPEIEPKRQASINKIIDFVHLKENADVVCMLFNTVVPAFVQNSLPGLRFDAVPLVNELEELCEFLINKIDNDAHAHTTSQDSRNEEDRASNDEGYEANPRWVFLTAKLRELCDQSEVSLLIRFPPHTRQDVAKILNMLRELDSLALKSKETPAKSQIETETSQPVEVPGSIEDTDEVISPRSAPSKVDSSASNSFVKHISTAILLHRNPLFLLISVCRGVFMLTFIPMVTIVVDFAMDIGVRQQDAKFVLAVLSLGDLLGRLCLGWVTDSGCLNLPRYMLCGMVLLGISSATLPYARSELSLLPAILIFGALQGSLFVRHQVLVSKYMKPEEQAIGMGCINFLAGFLGFALPYYIGYFRDTLGSYNKLLYVNGSICAIVGLFWLFEPYFVRFSSDHLDKNEKTLTRFPRYKRASVLIMPSD